MTLMKQPTSVCVGYVSKAIIKSLQLVRHHHQQWHITLGQTFWKVKVISCLQWLSHHVLFIFYLYIHNLFIFIYLRIIKNFVKEKKLKAAGSNFYEVDLCMIDSRTLIALQKKKTFAFLLNRNKLLSIFIINLKLVNVVSATTCQQYYI